MPPAVPRARKENEGSLDSAWRDLPGYEWDVEPPEVAGAPAAFKQAIYSVCKGVAAGGKPTSASADPVAPDTVDKHSARVSGSIWASARSQAFLITGSSNMSGFLRWIARGGLLVLLLQLCVVVDANAYQRGLAAGRAERSGSGPAGPGTGMGGSPAIPGFASPGLASPGLFTPVPATPVAAAKSKPTATPATPASVTGIGPDSADALERGGTQWALRKTLLR